MKSLNRLKSIRARIDAVDRKILDLLCERGQAAQEIGRLKKAHRLPIHAPSREQIIYDRLGRLNHGPHKTESILSIFREIISATRALETPLKVSFLGPDATFTHMAAVQCFGLSADFVPETGIQNVFAEVEKKRSDAGVVPVENSTEGIISHTLDLFVDSPLRISSEIVLRIRHHLLSREEKLEKIRRVYSHPHALAQCRNYLLSHLPGAVLKEVDSTSAAAKKAASERGSAAIASELASSRYGTPIQARDIEDSTQNYTRFLVIGWQKASRTGRDKTSILFVTKDKPGILFQVLSPIARARINLSKIESRPLKRKAWEYMFFMDLDGHIEEKRVARALTAVERRCSFFKILGSYPKSRI